ncbi:zinc finger protein 572-like isoform X2 [Zootermopsis nevadensis]|uniref:zinc finger protein 572-like isoform X2 n=1 Tax=Zootermopsis nevadensis TaxID=136037 RepID=UPI000B8E9CCD|nr:zinc finger protein 572-like isoform X2 [Zootermopsis nevadensis]
MTSAVVDLTAAATGNGIKDTVYSYCEDSSNSSDEPEHHHYEDKALDNVTETPSCKRPFQDSPTEPDQSQAKKRRKQSKPVRLFSLTEPPSEDEVEASSEGPTYSPTLKIPNSWSTQDHHRSSRPSAMMPMEGTVETGGHHVLASLFGTGDSSLKSYNCSYCPFTTPVLAFLFIHERSHTGLPTQQLPDPAKPFQCPVCLQRFLQADVFQHHVLTHQFSGVLNPFPGPSPLASYQPQIGNLREQIKFVQQQSPKNDENVERTKTEDKSECEVIEEDTSNTGGGRYKFRCSKCFQRFRSRENCLAHIQNRHISNSTDNLETVPSSSVETTAIKVTPNGLYKCTCCGFSSLHMVIVKKHIRKDHTSEINQFETRQEPETEELLELKDFATDEVKKKLQEAVRTSQVPASYAVPQNQTPFLDQFIMQPFLLEEPNGSRSSEQLQLDRKFVPSLVFLPVKEKLSEPLTVSFTLTPA